MSRRRCLPSVLRMIELATKVPGTRRRSFVHELLGKHEQQLSFGGGYTSWEAGRGLIFEYEVPKRICGNSEWMPLSAILSLADETTTWMGMQLDPSRRPGVSIALSAELAGEARPPQPGERLVFESHVQKLGRSVGFLGCDVFDAASGELRARAKHTKFLATQPPGWNVVVGKLFPLTSALVDRACAARAPPEVAVDDAAAFGQLVAPSRLQHASDGHTTAAFTVEASHLQENSILFGGCHAFFHESAGTAAAAAAMSADRADVRGSARPQLRSMRVEYLGGARKGAQLEAHVACERSAWRGEDSIVASSQLSLVRTTGARGNPKVGPGAHGGGASSGALRSEARMEFTLVD
jgi:acyl-coenzyme A thioesterase PaaI-like protein